MNLNDAVLQARISVGGHPRRIPVMRPNGRIPHPHIPASFLAALARGGAVASLEDCEIAVVDAGGRFRLLGKV